MKRRIYTEEEENRVIDHINSFPREESHYCRTKSSKEYLSQDLTIRCLFNAFKEAYPESKTSYRFYYNCFKEKFPKLSFKTPRTDTCNKCDILHALVKSNPSDVSVKHKLEIHHRKAEKAREVMSKDHADSQLPSSDTCTLSIDLQQVLSLPALTHTQMYYLRQMSFYNLGIHLADNGNVFLNLWHEAMSGRGANEIASCLLLAIEGGNITRNKKKLIVWSDNCSGQNKNQMLIFLWLYLISKGILEEVHQKFLVVGHSYLSCDRDFALIEKKKRKAKCEVSLDLVKIMVAARENNPFTVTVMEPINFFDFSKACKATLNTKKVEISKAQWICVTKSHPGEVLVKTTFNEAECFHHVNVLKKGVNMDSIINNLQPLPLKNHLSDGKKADLRTMVPYLKPENREFYEEVLGEN